MDWTTILTDAHGGLESFGAAQPEAVEGFAALHEASVKEGVISTKHKELIALAIGISKQCLDCIAFHTKAAMDAGATRKELEEMVDVCLLMGGGPAFMYGVKALKAYDEYAAAD